MTLRRTPRRVLITGAGGFVGTHLRSVLDGDEFMVAAPDRRQLDLTDEAAVHSYITEVAPETVVHLAACLDRSNSRAANAAQWADTFLSGRHVIDASIDAGARHLIMIGSLEELGPDMDPRHLNPRSYYGLCKTLVHAVANHAAATHHVGVDWVRPSIVYGPGQTGTMLIPSVLDALGRGQTAAVSDGLQSRDFLFVGDLVDWLRRCILSEPDRDGNVSVHTLGSGQLIQVSRVVELLRACFPDSEVSVGAVERRPGESDVVSLPEYRCERPGLADWKAGCDIASGLDRTVAWWRHFQDLGATSE